MKHISRWLYTTVVFLIIWIGLTGTLRRDEFLTGLGVSIILALFTYHIFTTEGVKNLTPKRVFCAVVYFFPFFFWEMIKANFDVAYRVISPKRPINPGIVHVKTKMKSDLGRLLVTSSITLTPGTFSLDIDDDNLFIHWINVKDTSIEGASEKIPGVFEKCLTRFLD